LQHGLSSTEREGLYLCLQHVVSSIEGGGSQQYRV
jgi:hypothetical protein